MTDVITVIADMSWWVKSAWLVWLAWLAVQVAWYRWGRFVPPGTVAPAPPERVDASRLAPISTAPHPAADAAHAPTSNRRRRRARRAPGFTTGLSDTAEAAR